MNDCLSVLAYGHKMGILTQNGDGRRQFSYSQEWLNSPDAFPLSVSIPLIAKDHEHSVVDAFLWGLLPDNDEVLRRWGSRFQVSPRNPFRLLSHVGEECAGAVQFVLPERENTLLTASPPGGVDWLDPRQLAERIAALRRDHAASRIARDRGSFSLAGAQPKTALHFNESLDKWGVPFGATPTTHILKPATGAFEGFAENEHFCQQLAAEMGLSAAKSRVMKFPDGPVICVERYDRIRVGDENVIRIHQEDMCQATGVHPERKYENQGGPSASQIIALLSQHSAQPSTDVKAFVEALAFNWVIAGTDAHAKNYSMLIAGSEQIRLAPLYDISSILPYPKSVDPRKATMAMKIGGEYKLSRIDAFRWERFANENRLSPQDIKGSIVSMAERLPGAVSIVAQRVTDDGMSHPILDRLSESLNTRAELILEIMSRAPKVSCETLEGRRSRRGQEENLKKAKARN